MTAIKFTFEDGSEALAHYGKKGMHWGTWNDETRQKYAANPEYMPENTERRTNEQLYNNFANAMNQHAANQGASAGQGTLYKDPETRGRNRMGLNELRRAQNAKDPVKQASNALNAALKGAKDFGGQVAKSVSDITKHASRAVSDAGKSVVDSGANAIDSLFGTKFGSKAQSKEREKELTNRWNKKRSANKYAQENSDRNKVLTAEAEWRQTQKKGKEWASKQAREDSAKKYAEENAKKNAELLKQAESKRQSKEMRERGEQKNLQKKYSDKIQKKSAQEYNRKAEKIAKNKQAIENDYKAEKRVNAGENLGDYKSKKLANLRTDDFYGKNGKAAQASEAYRRRNLRDKSEANMKKNGYFRGPDGVWRKKTQSLRKGH